MNPNFVNRYPNRMVSTSVLNDRGIVGQFTEDRFELTESEAMIVVKALASYDAGDEWSGTIAGIIDMFGARDGQTRSMTIVRTVDDD